MAESVSSEQNPNVLDLTLDERPVVILDQGPFDLRRPEELTLSEFGAFTGIGTVIQGLAEKAVDLETGTIDQEVLDEVQRLLASVVKSIFVDIPDEVAIKMTPGTFMKIARFFRGLSGETATPLSETAES